MRQLVRAMDACRPAQDLQMHSASVDAAKSTELSAMNGQQRGTVAKVLVVEDDPGEREALARVLRIEHYDVVTVENPEQALDYIDRGVDLILSDLRMGEGSGFDLLRYSGRQCSDTPFIVITACDDAESAIAAIKLGAKNLLTKPVDPDHLLELIRTCLEAHPPEIRAAPVSRRRRTRLSQGARYSDIQPPLLEVEEQTLENVQRAAILRALHQAEGNRTHAAKSLGISVRTLQRRLKDWRIGGLPNL
jgi:DNA-binding NtrC family response regulator